jgi:hypothetical protein
VSTLKEIGASALRFGRVSPFSVSMFIIIGAALAAAVSLLSWWTHDTLNPDINANPDSRAQGLIPLLDTTEDRGGGGSRLGALKLMDGVQTESRIPQLGESGETTAAQQLSNSEEPSLTTSDWTSSSSEDSALPTQTPSPLSPYAPPSAVTEMPVSGTDTLQRPAIDKPSAKKGKPLPGKKHADTATKAGRSVAEKSLPDMKEQSSKIKGKK